MVDNTELCLFFLIIGLLLASLLRKPTIEGQETMEKVAPKEGGEEGAPPKGGGGAEFKKMDKNTVCFQGTNIEDQAECDRAVKILKLKEGESITVEDGNMPPGCSYRTNEGGTNIKQWNTSKSGGPAEHLEPICYSGKSKQSGAGFTMDARSAGALKPAHDKLHAQLHAAEKAAAADAKKEKAVKLGQTWLASLGKENSLEFLKKGDPAGSIVPKGGIIMFSGEKPPPGWALCDGANGTPDLQDRFIMGSGKEPPGTEGGSPRITIANVPKHAHGTIGGWSTHLVGTVGGMSSAAGEWKKLQIRGSGEGKEDWSKSKDVGNDAEYYPPYYRLAFIIKL